MGQDCTYADGIRRLFEMGKGWSPAVSRLAAGIRLRVDTGQVSGSLCICGPSWKPPAYISQSVKWDYLTGASSGGTVIEIKGHDMGFVLSIMPGTKERNVL